jgi:hypothetical protein
MHTLFLLRGLYGACYAGARWVRLRHVFENCYCINRVFDLSIRSMGRLKQYMRIAHRSGHRTCAVLTLVPTTGRAMDGQFRPVQDHQRTIVTAVKTVGRVSPKLMAI